MDASGPVVAGLVAVGDALMHTNPTLSQNIAMTLWAAQQVARQADGAGLLEPGHVGFVHEYHAWALRVLRPWFELQVATDRGHEARLSGEVQSGVALAMAARLACAHEDPLVMRAWAAVRHLVRTPPEAFTPEVQARAERWLAAHPDFRPGSEGPSAEEWEALTTAPAKDVSAPATRSGPVAV